MKTNETATFFAQRHLLVAFALSIVATSVSANADGCMFRSAVTDTDIKVAALDSGKVDPQKASLYTRLGGYDAISAVVDDLVKRLGADPQLGRFWAHRGADGIKREKQLVVNFIVDRAGGPLYYGGRDMVSTHKGMKINDSDWKIFMGHLNATLEKFKVPTQEKTDVVNFMESLKVTMVE